MMTNHEVLSVYETMRGLTEQMLQAASGGDWDQLESLEQSVATQVRALKESEKPQALEGQNRLRKVALIKQMLEDDRKIRDLTMPWMAQLSNLINNTSTQRRVVDAYGVV
ncbi:flagellar protein FliT [Janthinobacterium sp.]|uniref:flagellar protein FliT n=1 Tax=Janthinobacterium sp. TaxID=1871054 RepID=UPI00293D663F|nr:flagellar protein FliT [Janthinobacterium sp.]